MSGDFKLAELSIKAIVRTVGMNGLAVALNNAFAFGKLLKKCDEDFEQEHLDEIFEGIEKFKSVAEKLDVHNGRA